MSRMMPGFSFKKHIETKMIEVENIKSVCRTIINEIKLSIQRNLNNVRLIIFTLIGDKVYECRVWVGQSVVYACPINIDNNIVNVYKIMIEKFITSSESAAYDLEVCRYMGFKVYTFKLDELENIELSVNGGILKIINKSAFKNNKSIYVKEERNKKYVSEVDKNKYYLVKCFSTIWKYCSTSDCKPLDSLLEALEMSGFSLLSTANTSRGGYICVLRVDNSDCKYAAVGVSEKIDVKCFESVDELVDFIRKNNYRIDKRIYLN